MAQAKPETTKAKKVQGTARVVQGTARDAATLRDAAPREGKAVAAVRAMRNRLAAESSLFKDAVSVEAEAEKFCRDIRKQLREQRNDQKVDQSVVGKRLDMSQSAVSKIETGDGDIGLKTIFRYARALGLRPDCFFVPIIEAKNVGQKILEDAERQIVNAIQTAARQSADAISNASNAMAELKSEK